MMHPNAETLRGKEASPENIENETQTKKLDEKDESIEGDRKPISHLLNLEIGSNLGDKHDVDFKVQVESGERKEIQSAGLETESGEGENGKDSAEKCTEFEQNKDKETAQKGNSETNLSSSQDSISGE